MGCGAQVKLAHVQLHDGLLRGLAGLQPGGLPAQPSRVDGPRRRCHALGAVTARRVCSGRRSGASVEGSPAAAVEEGLHGGHQRSEGMASGMARETGAHPRWPREGEGQSGVVGVAFIGGEGLR
jgi:hypothetical protein